MSVTWRPATHADLPRILELWDEQERRFEGTGVPVDRPELFRTEGHSDRPWYPYCPPVVRVRVAERDGEIVMWKYQELVPETCIVGSDKEAMETIGNELTEDAHWLKSVGFRSGWGLIPKRFIGVFARFLRKHPHIRPWKSLTPVGVNFEELGD